MEKFERIAVMGDIHAEPGKAMTGGRLDLFTLAGTINAHSEAIEEQADALQSLTCRVRRLERRSLRHGISSGGTDG